MSPLFKVGVTAGCAFSYGVPWILRLRFATGPSAIDRWTASRVGVLLPGLVYAVTPSQITGGSAPPIALAACIPPGQNGALPLVPKRLPCTEISRGSGL